MWNIDANYGDRILCCCCGHCVLLVRAPLASLSLGQEHGRTIPLPEVRPIVRQVMCRSQQMKLCASHPERKFAA
jgi:hypothetical protein